MSIDARDFQIGSLATVQAGYPFRSSVEAVANGSVWAVQMKDIAEGGEVDWTTVVRTELPSIKSAVWLRSGDVLFVARGQRFYACCVNEPPARAVCSPHFFHLRVLPGAGVLPAFLAWLINRAPVQRQLRQAAEGSNQLSIRRAEVEAVKVRVPSLSDQQRIVAIARLAQQEHSALQRLILNREREMETLAQAFSPLQGQQP